ncbi:hypothetical protein SAMN02910436_02482 [Ruminococcaceae bacterium P7]|nr:hypothetical protein SAMN02910436_02482 [Ruminococcaceae bacterium P7]
MIINSVHISDPDVSDVLFMENFEREQDIVKNKVNSSDGKSRAQIMREQCIAVFNFFDNVFGEGTAKKVFGEKVNLVVCVDAYGQALTEVNRLDAEAGKRLKAKYTAKYGASKGKKKSKKKSPKKRYNTFKPKLAAPKQ